MSEIVAMLASFICSFALIPWKKVWTVYSSILPAGGKSFKTIDDLVQR